MGRQLNRSGAPIRREQAAPTPPPPAIDTSSFVERDALEARLAGYAPAEVLEEGLSAVIEAMPVVASDTPLPEAIGGDPGAERHKVSGADHRHPRLTSTTGNTDAVPTSHVIGGNGTVLIRFTRKFDTPPGTVFTEVPPIAAGAMSEFPVTFRVDAWTVESGKIVGCRVRAWRGRALPVMNALTGILNLTGVNGIITALTGFNPFAAPATGTAFTCIAVARSDV